MTLPYRWQPLGTHFRCSPPEVGSLIAFEHAVWRVVEVRRRPADLADGRTISVVVRPVGVTGDDPRARDHDLHLGCDERTSWDVYSDEHYPVCATCSEPLPCRERMAERVSAEAVARMGRYELVGCCPACCEPVSVRQRSLTFPDNLEVLGGPPVTFHLRSRCGYSAARYEQRWVAADPERRRARLSCPGHVTNHNDGTYDCTQLGECPGPAAAHPSYSVCGCPDCHARGSFGCTPAATAQRNTGEPA